ncbi:HAD-superfamily hydrolase, subfamily IA, variant 3 [Leadbetterella byssophila DSM 17132]|uniref:HAD-superfamily hydrolase, subfamily IA, variant 3 n=1 Tax=Leadbetterella byssophila (strain DSM 17132 / JCM 16389 / KACC 11308 / NBRC 106382 / 4M15) TaxID=649349 RepID=E4RVB0_LEAB4|nr:HAD family phosphatase [Leadbetterella byssophila]ADQ16096.1 HAD-superfamily hydrolase, subfamily IA, variant 3 [Leadbetterella byssophila DSM 17132]
MPAKTKAVVFDFGNVIIPIDLERTFQAFADLTFKSKERIKELFAQAELFKKYETGFYSDDEFRDVVRQTLSYPLNDQEIDEAWNALLLEIPKERIDYLERLKFDIPIYLLSNTNSLHIEYCQQYFRQAFGIANFTKLFEKAFLSYEMGLWKPDYAIYHQVINEIGVKPEEILFLDDNPDNVEAANEVGIRAVQISPHESFTTLLPNLL